MPNLVRLFVASMVLACVATVTHAQEKYVKYYEAIQLSDELLPSNQILVNSTSSWIIKSADGLNESTKIHLGDFSSFVRTSFKPISYVVSRNEKVLFTAKSTAFNFQTSKPNPTAPSSEPLMSVFVDGPQLQIGDTVRWSYSLIPFEEDAKKTGNSWVRDLTSSTITKAFDYQLIAPKNVAVNIQVQGVTAPSKSFDKLDKQVWRYSGVMAFKEPSTELATAPQSDRSPALIISTYASWKDVGQAYLAGEEAALGAGLNPSLVKSILGDSQDDLKTLNRAFQWIQKSFRYDATRISSENRIRPRNLSAILASGTADCKEMALLLKAVLGASKIAAQTVALNSQSNRFLKFPVFDFDHVIVYVPSLDLYVDPTNTNVGFGVISDSFNGKSVLKLGDDELQKMRVPKGAAAVRSSELISIGNEGEISSELTVTTTGYKTKFLSELFNGKLALKAAYAETINNNLSKLRNSEQITEAGVLTVRMTDERSSGGAVTLFASNKFESKYSLTSPFEKTNGRLPKGTGFGNLLLQMPLYQTTQRVTPILCGFTHEATDEVFYSFPREYQITAPLESRLTFEGGIFKYERNLSIVSPNVIKVHRTLTVDSEKTVCPATDYAVWVDFAKKVIGDYLELPIQVSTP